MTLRSDRAFANPSALFDALADSMVARIEAAIQTRGQALIAVSGGQSPKPLFERMSVRPVTWSRVIITQVDERWVDPRHADSNARLIREHLLTHRAAAARFVSFKNDAETPELGRRACETALGALPRPFDVVILGMGEDGHTASLFPGAEELAKALDPSQPDLCTPVHPPVAPHARVSLTLRGLLDSRVLILPLVGRGKLETLRVAETDGPVEQMPIRALLRQLQVPLEIWSTAESG